MKLDMPFKDYIQSMVRRSNEPLTLNKLTQPFGIMSNDSESNSLLVGHILEVLMESLTANQAVDCIDVVAAAYELGHEVAGEFLDEMPYIITEMANEMGLNKLH